ncbi:MAG: hypothetical protein WC254_04220 [Candidatus Woesearchaeota archaeon]|jgi:tetratricopeptide (TPR) repeat protein
MDIDEFLESESPGEAKPGRKDLVEKQAAEFISDSSLDGQLAKIRELMQARKYKDAEKIYFTVKEQYALLAKRQEEARKRLHRELMAINKELLEHLNRLKEEMGQKALIINDLLMKARQYMQKGDTDKANQLYIQVREIFKQIPDAFSEQKMLMENQILSFYSQLVNEFNKKNYGKLLEKRDELVRHIEIATNDIRLNQVDHAKKEYMDINKLYNELPEGFLYEKTLIYKRILALYQFIEEGVSADIPELKKPAPLTMMPLFEPQQVQIEGKQTVKSETYLTPVQKKALSNVLKKEEKQEKTANIEVKTERKRVMDAPPLPL